MFCVNIIRFQGGFGRWNLMLTINNTFSRRDIAFTSDFCNNHSHPVSPASLYLTSLRPRPTRPRVPYLMSSSHSSRVPPSQVPTHASRCPCPLVPVPLLYTALLKFEISATRNCKRVTAVCRLRFAVYLMLKVSTLSSICFSL